MQMHLPFTDSYLSVRLRRPAAPRAPRPAAGVLLHYVDAEGDWYLLGRRATVLGGTWANLGGSLEPDEHPLAGALREFSEEAGLPVSRLIGATIANVIEVADDDVPYTLFVLDVVECFVDARLTWENTELTWFHASQVPALDLHRSFRSEWDALFANLTEETV